MAVKIIPFASPALRRRASFGVFALRESKTSLIVVIASVNGVLKAACNALPKGLSNLPRFAVAIIVLLPFSASAHVSSDGVFDNRQGVEPLYAIFMLFPRNILHSYFSICGKLNKICLELFFALW